MFYAKISRAAVHPWLLAAFLSLSAACSGGDGAGSPPPANDNGGETVSTGLIEGSRGALVTSAIDDFFIFDPVTENEYSEDVFGSRIQRTGLKIVFSDTATVGQVNDLLNAIDAKIVATLAGYPATVVRVPDPGSLEQLGVLISQIESNGAVHNVLRSEAAAFRILPPNVHDVIFNTGSPDTNFAAEWDTVDHHLAVRGAAAWTLENLVQQKPKLIVADYFGAGNPNDTLFDLELLPEESDFGFGFAPPPFGSENHGYGMLSIIAARHSAGGQFGDAEFASGMLPGGAATGVVDIQGQSWQAAKLHLLARARDAADRSTSPVIVNMSLGRDCKNTGLADPCIDPADLNDMVVDFIRSVRHIDGERRVLFVVAAGNVVEIGPTDAKTQSEWAAASLLDQWTDRLTGEAVAPLSNVLVVENAVAEHTLVPPFLPGCVHSSSFVGGHIAGIGVGVHTINAPDADFPASVESGTSHATAQLSGVAAYISALRPDFDPQTLIRILVGTAEELSGSGTSCTSLQSSARIVDAYAAALAADAGGSLDPAGAKARLALLDVTDATLGDSPDGVFNIFDLQKWVLRLSDPSAPGEIIDYGRFDLNGDGITGGEGTERFDLDASFNPATPSISAFGLASSTLFGRQLLYSESEVTDAEIVCYYANSELYELDDSVDIFGADARDEELRKVRSSCDPCFVAQQQAALSATFSSKALVDEGTCEDPPLLVSALHVVETETGSRVGSDDIFRISADGQTIEQLTFDVDPSDPDTARFPALSPDRSRIAFHWSRNGTLEVVVMDADGANQQQVFSAGGNVFPRNDVLWTTDGMHLMFPATIGTGASFEGFGIFVVGADGTNLQELLRSDREIFEMSLSPDGNRIVYTQRRAAPLGTFGLETDLIVADVVVQKILGEDVWAIQNPVPLQIPALTFANRDPKWSPDGSAILFASTIESPDTFRARDIFAIAPDGSGYRHVTGPDAPVDTGGGFMMDLGDHVGAWSPTGDRVAVVRVAPFQDGSHIDGVKQLFVIDADGSGLTQVTPVDLGLTINDVAWAPQ